MMCKEMKNLNDAYAVCVCCYKSARISEFVSVVSVFSWLEIELLSFGNEMLSFLCAIFGMLN